MYLGMNKRQLLSGVAGLFIAWVLLFGLASIVRTEIGNTALNSLDLAISGGLSVALVVLYFRQTQILESQRELITHELNREVRMSHTETLRERVRIWHGDPERKDSPDPFEASKLNIPQVTRTSFQSAPDGVNRALSREETFYVVPYQLQDDRYLTDLLENHAPELNEAKQQIERLQEEFISLRENFITEYDDGVVVDRDAYLLEPSEYLSRWVFEQILLIKRGDRKDTDDIFDIAKSGIESAHTSSHPDKPKIWVQTERSGKAIYGATIKSGDKDEIRKYQKEIKQDTIDAVREVLDAIDQNPNYRKADKAADVLDEATEAVAELEQLLIEYEGKPVYSGECEYLNEATV